MVEDLAGRTVSLIDLGAADKEVQLLGCRVDGAGRTLFIGQRVVHLQRVSVSHSLSNHEVYLVVFVQSPAVQSGMSVAPTGT